MTEKRLPSVFPFPYVRLFCILPASFLYYLSGVIWGLHLCNSDWIRTRDGGLREIQEMN